MITALKNEIKQLAGQSVREALVEELMSARSARATSFVLEIGSSLVQYGQKNRIL